MLILSLFKKMGTNKYYKLIGILSGPFLIWLFLDNGFDNGFYQRSSGGSEKSDKLRKFAKKSDDISIYNIENDNAYDDDQSLMRRFQRRRFHSRRPMGVSMGISMGVSATRASSKSSKSKEKKGSMKKKDKSKEKKVKSSELEIKENWAEEGIPLDTMALEEEEDDTTWAAALEDDEVSKKKQYGHDEEDRNREKRRKKRSYTNKKEKQKSDEDRRLEEEERKRERRRKALEKEEEERLRREEERRKREMEETEEDHVDENPSNVDPSSPDYMYVQGLFPKDKTFRKKVNCDMRRPEWQQYRHVYEIALAREEQPEEWESLATALRILSSVLWARARNVTDILTCNTGVIAGYQRLAHGLAVAGLAPKTAMVRYRLLQMALIFIFTLRNANRIPKIAAEYWSASEQYIIPNIMGIRRHVEAQEIRKRRDRELWTGRSIDPTFRDPNMRVAIVSICAYPATSDIALKDVTPLNRELYADRHGYSLRLHTEPPLLGGNVQIQHAKLATVNYYIRSGEFDWVVWLDCDSLIMNLDRTIDSIIYRAAGVWTSNSFAGEWADTWSSGNINITVNENHVKAEAQQFGIAHGFMNGKVLKMTFPNALEPLEAHLEKSLDGDMLSWSNGAVWHRTRKVEPCKRPGTEHCPELKGLDDTIDMLITEEGWGLSSANWMVRRSPWTIWFLDECLEIAHVKIPLFGDQDAIIYMLMNDQTLRSLATSLDENISPGVLQRLKSTNESDQYFSLDDPLDSHARVIPQRELNAYDHLNAYTMDVDGFEFGDFLITFPQCKDASCNGLFNLAVEYAHNPKEFGFNPYDWAHVRLFGPRELVQQWWTRHMSEREKEKDEEIEMEEQMEAEREKLKEQGLSRKEIEQIMAEKNRDPKVRSTNSDNSDIDGNSDNGDGEATKMNIEMDEPQDDEM